MSEFDAVVVGASVGGSTAAALLAEHGARVALVEKAPDPVGYKHLCTHELIGAIREPLGRLGLLDAFDSLAQGHRSLNLWTRHGWIKPESDAGHPLVEGFNIRRETIDPILRERAMGADGVETFLGSTATGLLGARGQRPEGVVVRSRDGRERELRARVIVAADGRSSGIARMAGAPARVKPHGRIGYAAYFEGVEPHADFDERPQMWLRDPDVAYHFPTDGGLRLFAVMARSTKERVAAFRADLEGEFMRALDGLPGMPDVRAGRRVGQWKGALTVDNQWRPAATSGVGFVGDAAQVSDYLWGTGCGFAMRSAMWLADAVGPDLARGADASSIDRSLRRYRRRHRRELAGHHLLATDYSTGRAFSGFEHALYRAAARDRRVAQAIGQMAGRVVTPQKAMAPVLGRVALGALRPAGR